MHFMKNNYTLPNRLIEESDIVLQTTTYSYSVFGNLFNSNLIEDTWTLISASSSNLL